MSKFHFNQKAEKFRMAKQTILDRMANNAVYQFKVINFDASGFVDFGVKKWAPRKESSNSRQLLVKSGRGRESITVLKKSIDSRIVGTVVPYMAYHNSGTTNLPQRKIIGNSKALEEKNLKVINEEMRKIFK